MWKRKFSDGRNIDFHSYFSHCFFKSVSCFLGLLTGMLFSPVNFWWCWFAFFSLIWHELTSGLSLVGQLVLLRSLMSLTKSYVLKPNVCFTWFYFFFVFNLFFPNTLKIFYFLTTEKRKNDSYYHTILFLI